MPCGVHFNTHFSLVSAVMLHAKVKSLYMTRKACMGSRGIAPFTPYSGTRCRWLFNFKSRSLYSREKNPGILNRRLRGLQSRCECYGTSYCVLGCGAVDMSVILITRCAGFCLLHIFVSSYSYYRLQCHLFCFPHSWVKDYGCAVSIILFYILLKYYLKNDRSSKIYHHTYLEVPNVSCAQILKFARLPCY